MTLFSVYLYTIWPTRFGQVRSWIFASNKFSFFPSFEISLDNILETFSSLASSEIPYSTFISQTALKRRPIPRDFPQNWEIGAHFPKSKKRTGNGFVWLRFRVLFLMVWVLLLFVVRKPENALLFLITATKIIEMRALSGFYVKDNVLVEKFL